MPDSQDIETISHAANTFDHLLVLFTQFQLVPQPVNEHVEIPQFVTILATPDPVQQVGVGKHLAAMQSQLLEEIKLCWRQFDFLSGSGYPSIRKVDFQVATDHSGT